MKKAGFKAENIFKDYKINEEFKFQFSEIGQQNISAYEQLLKDNNLDPNMYHPVVTIEESGEDFARNKVTIIITAMPNKPQAGNED